MAPNRTRTTTLRPTHRGSFSPELITSAESCAHAGHLTLAADLCEYICHDDRMLATTSVRADTLLGLPLDVTPEGSSSQDDAAVEALKSDYITICPEQELRSFLIRGWVGGWSPGELIWAPQASGREVPTISPIHPRNLRYDWEKREWKLKTATGNHSEVEVPFLPGNGHHVLFTPYGSERPWSAAPWLALSRWVQSKQYAIADWALFCERHGNATTVAESAPAMGPVNTIVKQAELSPEGEQSLLTDIESLHRNGVIVMPQGYKLSLLEAAGRTFDTFRETISSANEGIAVTMLGQNLSTSVGQQGSLAAVEAHKDIAITKSVADSESFSTFLHTQVTPWWALFNFGRKGLAPWARYRVRDLQAEAAQRMAASMQMASQALVPLVAQDILSADQARAFLQKHFGVLIP